MTTLFISDLHLDSSRPAIARAFLSFLEEHAGQVKALYILGDFFETWIGDDDDDPFHTDIIARLRVFTRQTPCFIMHGNRDFLIGEQFCELTGCQLLDDPVSVDLYGKQVLLMHGDTLCTEDVDYLAFRKQVRDPAWQQDFLGKPLAERRAIAQHLREASQQAAKTKAVEIMDVTPAEVERVMANAGIELLIHGHTHRPNIHDNAQGKRIVLGDWDKQGWVLRCHGADDFSLTSFDL